MAVIRCQACGKPNPDFLEECQFCDARLKPLTGMLTPSPNALPPLAPMTPPAPDPEPATDANIIKCQACGKPNPIFLDTCQFCDARLKPLTAEPEALDDEASAPATEWLISTRAAPTEAPASDLPDWLRAMEPSTAESTPAMPEPEPAAEIPEWMRGEAESTPSAQPATTTPDWLSASPPATAAEDDVPDWLRAIQPPAAETAPAADWMASAEAVPPAPASAADDEVPDWLRAMEAPTSPAPAGESPVDIPDWMQADSGPAASAPATGEAPSWLSAAPEPAASAEDDVPDWLRAMQSPTAPAPASEPTTAPAQPATDDSVPDWLRTMQSPTADTAPTPPASESEPDEDSSTDWLVSRRAPQPKTPTGDLPDWLQAMEAATPQTSAMPEPPPAESESDVPDWMSALGGATATAATEDLPDWMQSSGAPETLATPVESTPATVDDGMPDWLKAMQPSAGTPDAPGASETSDADMPSWMTTMENASTMAALPPVSAEMALPDDAPDWLKAMQGTGELSALQAESAAAEAETPATEAGGDWLSALRGSTAELEPLSIGDAPALASPEDASRSDQPAASGLEEAALPSWLAAMKPIEVQAAPLDEEADAYEERVGVLAGMRGVLRAEPVVALPRKSTVQVHKLDISTDQTRQASILAALVSADIQARVTPKRRLAILPMVERWLVVLVLLVAIALPLYSAPGLFPLPTTISLQTQAAFNTLNALPADKPALVVFDYDPAQSGELNPSASALVRHLLLRGITVVSLSTRPAGAILGDTVVSGAALNLESTFSYTYGVNYISLGYLPGGPVGVAQFAANPRGAFAADFRDEHADVWNTSALSRLSAEPGFTLNNFGGLIVLAATPDSARAWIEQAHPQAPEVAMVMAVSAGVEPLIRPYFEADVPVLKGIVSGLPGAAQYEAQAGAGFSHDTTAQSWTVIGGGLVFGALPLLIVGNIIASIVNLARRRPSRRR